MTDMIGESLEIRTALMAVTHKNADPRPLIARCDGWLAQREIAEWEIRNARFAVAQQLDNLDRATDAVKAVRGKCCSILRSAKAAH